jgi:hypothetical protein
MISPNDISVAYLDEGICSDGLFQTTIVDYVQVARRGVEPTRENDVFATDVHGGLEDHPAVQWLSSQKLQITVPNKSLIGLQKGSYNGVDVAVTFDPDDPVARQQFLKSLGLQPK